jgi:hypothetical protein
MQVLDGDSGCSAVFIDFVLLPRNLIDRVHSRSASDSLRKKYDDDFYQHHIGQYDEQ